MWFCVIFLRVAQRLQTLSFKTHYVKSFWMMEVWQCREKRWLNSGWIRDCNRESLTADADPLLPPKFH